MHMLSFLFFIMGTFCQINSQWSDIFLHRVWSKDGCSVKTTGHSKTICKSSHLTTFALLSKVEKKVGNKIN